MTDLVERGCEGRFGAREGAGGGTEGGAARSIPDRGRRGRLPVREARGLSRDLERAGLLSGMGVVGFLDLLALDDLTTSVQPDHLAEIVFLLVSIPALVVLFTLWRRAAGPDDAEDPGDAGQR